MESIANQKKIQQIRGWICIGVLLVSMFASANHGWADDVITLSDGHQYRFAGTSWGTNHTTTGVLPPVAVQLTNYLIIWLEPTGTNASVPFQDAFLAGKALEIEGVLVDENGSDESTPSLANFLWSNGGQGIYNGSTGPPGIAFVAFPAPPRRRQMLECRLVELSGNGSTVVRPDLELLKFHNPLFGQYPQWQPEALPAIKPAGDDINVRLNSFGRGPGISRGPVIPSGPTYQFSVTFESSRDNNEKWTVAGLEVVDATGNRISGSGTRIDQDVRNSAGPETYGIYGAFWPDEAAVRLALTLKRTSGFPASELVTFTNLPVLQLFGSYAPANGTSLTNSLDGIPIVVRNMMTDVWHKFHSPWPGAYGVELDVPTHPPGVIADIVEVTTDAGKVLTAPDSVGPNARTYIEYDQGPSPKYLNVTVVVQKTRTAEFLVKP